MLADEPRIIAGSASFVKALWLAKEVEYWHSSLCSRTCSAAAARYYLPDEGSERERNTKKDHDIKD